MSFGIALSGGGIKGAAHIGVLQALKEENIKIDYISGTSAGSIVASLYAAGYTPYEILKLFNGYADKIIEFDKKLMFKIISSFANQNRQITNMTRSDNLESLLYSALKLKKVVYISDIKDIKLAITTVDINSGDTVYFTNEEPKRNYNAKLASIIRASSGIPIIFEAKTYKNMLLVDGGIKVNVPVKILKEMGADKVLAINLQNKITPLYNKSIFDVGFRCIDIMGNEIVKDELKEANLILDPDLSEINLFDLKLINTAANIGYYKAKENIEKIREMYINS